MLLSHFLVAMFMGDLLWVWQLVHPVRNEIVRCAMPRGGGGGVSVPGRHSLSVLFAGLGHGSSKEMKH